MHGKLRGRKTEDQPAASRIDMFESEHVGQERAIGVGIAAEQDDVTAIDHPHRMPRSGAVMAGRVALAEREARCGVRTQQALRSMYRLDVPAAEG